MEYCLLKTAYCISLYGVLYVVVKVTQIHIHTTFNVTFMNIFLVMAGKLKSVPVFGSITS